MKHGTDRGDKNVEKQREDREIMDDVTFRRTYLSRHEINR